MKTIKILLAALIIASCATEKKESAETSDPQKDGIYPTEKAWDIIHEGKTYEFDCDPAGLTVLTDNIIPEYYTIGFEYKEVNYKTARMETKTDWVEFTYIGEPKEGKFLFGTYWFDYINSTQFIENIIFSIPDGNNTRLTYGYEQHKEIFHKMIKYMKSNGRYKTR